MDDDAASQHGVGPEQLQVSVVADPLHLAPVRQRTVLAAEVTRLPNSGNMALLGGLKHSRVPTHWGVHHRARNMHTVSQPS